MIMLAATLWTAHKGGLVSGGALFAIVSEFALEYVALLILL